MLDSYKKVEKSTDSDYQFSILIPTWNNLALLQNCIQSIRRNAALKHQIIVCINEGKDGTLEWVDQQTDIDYIHTPTNIGICYGMNLCRSLVKAEYIMYLNDDMYVCPDWDVVLWDRLQSIGTKMAMLSGTMIEPYDSNNPCVVVQDYGTSLSIFNEEKLLDEYKKRSIPDWSGSTWPPNVLHIDLWDLVGGLSIEYSPGMYSDPDFSKKIYEAGVHTFIGCGNSLVYHFGRQSTGRIKQHSGRNTFLRKWKIPSSMFTKKVLHIGQPYQSKRPEQSLNFWDRMKVRLKLFWA